MSGPGHLYVLTDCGVELDFELPNFSDGEKFAVKLTFDDGHRPLEPCCYVLRPREPKNPTSDETLKKKDKELKQVNRDGITNATVDRYGPHEENRNKADKSLILDQKTSDNSLDYKTVKGLVVQKEQKVDTSSARVLADVHVKHWNQIKCDKSDWSATVYSRIYWFSDIVNAGSCWSKLVSDQSKQLFRENESAAKRKSNGEPAPYKFSDIPTTLVASLKSSMSLKFGIGLLLIGAPLSIINLGGMTSEPWVRYSWVVLLYPLLVFLVKIFDLDGPDAARDSEWETNYRGRYSKLLKGLLSARVDDTLFDRYPEELGGARHCFQVPELVGQIERHLDVQGKARALESAIRERVAAIDEAIKTKRERYENSRRRMLAAAGALFVGFFAFELAESVVKAFHLRDGCDLMSYVAMVQGQEKPLGKCRTIRDFIEHERNSHLLLITLTLVVSLVAGYVQWRRPSESGAGHGHH